MKPSPVVRNLLLFIIYLLINISRSEAQTFVGVSANPADGAAATYTNATVTVTPPASMVAGDLVVIYAHYRNSAGNLNITTDGGQTWTSETQYNNGNQRTRVFWCRFNGLWSADPVITRSSATTEALTAIMYVFRPTNSINNWVKYAGLNNSTSTNAAVTINGITTTDPNTVTMAFWSSEDDNQWGNLTGAGWSKTGLSAQYRNVGGTDQSHTAAYNIQTLPATLSNVSQTQTASGPDNTKTTLISFQEIVPEPATVDYGKSYANISKLSGGGTIAVGDTLEIRATLVVRTLAVDSLAFIDTLPKGVHFVPGSIAIKTNEGKIYRWDNTSAAPPVAFTDNSDTDPGHIYNSGGDSVIRINIGVGSTGTARGKLRHTTPPRIGNATTGNAVIMATYRVVVDTTFSAILNLGGGYFTARDSATATMRTLSFSPRSVVVYETPGLCPNALSPANAIADEFGGTFGNSVLSATNRPMKNRAPSSNVPGYTYSIFSGSTPNDYYYGVSNNTGAGGANYTAVNTWPKNSTRRVHQVWDITGDHTGSANPALGNPACDTTLPASPTNPCGYMLVVNSSYKTDTAFQYNINNLCPNTYYEISFWVKNICAKCGADSLGRWASSTGYIPTDLNDSSGVRPNLAIDINGIDYYTTGQIEYVGTNLPQTLQDNANIWVKRGFTYLTGPTPGTLTMSIRNTAPGGGGNDWALDDISVATCFPNMSYSPSLTPNVCIANPLTIYDTVRSYFNNYNYYKWQRSTDGGGSWTDVSSAFGPVTPTFNGSLYEYVSSYTIAPAQATLANAGDLYRLITATTSSNLSSEDCISTDFSSIVTLNVIDCEPVLNTKLLSFNGKLLDTKAALSWVTSKEDEQITYIIERSINQSTFTEAGRLNGFNNIANEKNYYSFQDPSPVSQKTWYRIVMINAEGKKQYSRIILLDNSHPDFGFGNVINPFTSNLYFDVTSKENSKIDVTLIDMSGKPVIRKSYVISSGTNSLSIDNTSAISQGVYTLKIENKGAVITKRVVKRN